MSNPLALTTVNIVTNPQPGGIWNFANAQMTEARGALTVLAGIIAVIIVIAVAMKTKAMASTAIAIVLGAILVFVVSGGLEKISGIFGETMEAGSASVFSPASKFASELNIGSFEPSHLTQVR
jgi:hypothetical protein